jgi:uncharacterized protein involved in exopolysaccharide biosynthesis
MQLMSILRRRRRLIVLVTVCGAILAGALGLLIPPKYTATAQIVIEPQQAAAIGSQMDAARPTDQSAIDTHVMMLTSRAHLGRVLASLSSASASATSTDPAHAETGDAPPPNDRLPPATSNDRTVEPIELTNTALSFGELARRVKIWLAATIGGTPPATREIEELDRGLKVIQERASRVISVSFTDKSPVRAAAIANRVVQIYVDDQAKQRRAQVNQELAALDARAAILKSELTGTSEVMQSLLLQAPSAAASGAGEDRGARLRALQREAAASGQAYAGLLQRQKDIRDMQEIVTPEIRVLSLASPPNRPSSVNPILFVFPASTAALIAACLLAVLLDRLDRGLRSERDVADAVGLPCIGIVPQLPRFHAHQPLRYLLGKPFTPYTEAIRSVVASLHLTDPQDGPTTVLISSSVPGEGKTTTTVSLCAFAARLGRRVLLIDFDTRHPSARHLLPNPFEARAVASQDRPLEEIIQHFADIKLDYLPIPRSPTDPVSPFVGTRMQESLRQLGSRYDCIFIDSPPLLGVTETRLLASLVDRVVFLVKWSSTRREVVQNAGTVLRGALRNDGVRASALLTQVNLSRHADYRYGDVAEAFAIYRNYYFGPAKA